MYKTCSTCNVPGAALSDVSLASVHDKTIEEVPRPSFPLPAGTMVDVHGRLGGKRNVARAAEALATDSCSAPRRRQAAESTTWEIRGGNDSTGGFFRVCL
jgi:hypothetical protein